MRQCNRCGADPVPSLGGDAGRDRAERRRTHLLDTARTLFIDHGFHGTGIARIATASGIGVGQIYRDFDDKEAIVAAICETDVAAWLEEDVLAAAVAADDAEAIRGWIRRFGSREPLSKCRMMVEIVAESARNPRIADIHRTAHRRVHASLSTALAALTHRGRQDADVSALATLILAIGAGVMTRRLIDPQDTAERLTRHVRALIDAEIARLTG